MKPELRRKHMLNRLSRLRQIERMQALDELSSANQEHDRLEQLNQRSRAMLDSTDSAAAGQGGDLANALKFRAQLSRLAESTDDLQREAQERATYARDRLQQAERRLEMTQQRATEASAVSRREDQASIATSRKVARHLHRRAKSNNSQGRDA